MNTITVGNWEISEDLFDQYLRLIQGTERSSGRYNYEFDKKREMIHEAIIRDVGLSPHSKDYRDFQKALTALCEEMLPPRFQPEQVTALETPLRGLIR